MRKMDLGGVWELKRLDDSWKIKAQLPGSIYQAMLEAKMLPEFYLEGNKNLYQEVMRHDYSFSRSFTVGKADLAAGVSLCCDGVDTLGEIYLNGRLLAKTENMHRFYRFPAAEALQEGENTIEVIIRSPLNYCDEKQKEEFLLPIGNVGYGFGHLRKGSCMMGWDWVHGFPDGGIWKSIYLEFLEDGRIDSVFVTQTHRDGQVTLHVSAELVPAAQGLRAELTFDGETYPLAVCGPRLETQVTVKAPRLWYPNGCGEQYLYPLSFRLLAGDKPVDSYGCNIGLRQVELIQKEDEWGRSFYFEVNGIPVFMKGSNYIIEDMILSRSTPARTEALLQAAADCHHNAIRIWGGAFYGTDAFYDACDRLGLLVWQDLLFACSAYPGNNAFYENIYAETQDNVRRLRNHPSLVVWCGNNECETFIGHWQKAAFSDFQRRDYLVQYESVLKHAVESSDPTRPYWPSSPSSGGGFVKSDAPAFGDTHQWEMWFGREDLPDAVNSFPRFTSEFGFQSYPAMETLRAAAKPESLFPLSSGMDYFQRDTDGNSKIAFFMARNFRQPKDLDSYSYVSQLLQAVTVSVYTQHWRRNRNGQRCMGALYWQINDCWPGITWASIDYFGRWKALQYESKRMFAPVLVSCCQAESGQVELHVTNDQPTAASLTLYWELREADGRTLAQGDVEAAAPALADSLVLTIPREQIPENPAGCYLEYGQMQEGKKETLGVFLFCRQKAYPYQPAAISFAVTPWEEGTQIVLRSDVFANFVELKALDGKAIFSDNFFPLVPGREKVVYTEASAEAVRASLTVRSIRDSYL